MHAYMPVKIFDFKQEQRGLHDNYLLGICVRRSVFRLFQSSSQPSRTRHDGCDSAFLVHRTALRRLLADVRQGLGYNRWVFPGRGGGFEQADFAHWAGQHSSGCASVGPDGHDLELDRDARASLGCELHGTQLNLSLS